MRFCPECSERLSNVDAIQCEYCYVSLAEAATPFQRYRLRGLGMVVMIAIAVAVATRGLWVWQAVSDLNVGRHPEGAQRAFAGISYLAFLISSVVFLAWLWQARRNLEAYPEAANLKVKAWWVFGSWFIPLVGLVMPYHVMRDVALVSTRSRTIAGLVLAGWIAFLAQTPVVLLGPTAGPVIVAALLFASAGGCLAVFVGAVSRAQASGHGTIK